MARVLAGAMPADYSSGHSSAAWEITVQKFTVEKFVTAVLVAVAVFFASGYVFSTPVTDAQASPAPVTTAHLDAHVGYYAQHLTRLGLTQSQQ
jgi:hypothetical protein